MAAVPLNMSCGQTDLHPDCLEALGKQLGTPIYYPSYPKLEFETMQLIQQLGRTQNDVLLLAGSATYGEEAAMLTAVELGDKVIALNTGTFGQVLTDLVRVAGGTPIELKTEMGKSIAPGEVRSCLEANPDARMVAVVHSETSAGTMNPVREIGEILRGYPQTLYMVDAVSSFGAAPVNIDEWGIDILCTSTQKCLNAPQGLAIVVVSRRAWERIAAREKAPPTVCLDLRVWRSYSDGVRRSAVGGGGPRDISFEVSDRLAHGPSPSFSLVRGLNASLKGILEEGPENVHRRHRVAGKAVREAARAMGVVKVLADEEVAAPMCTSLVYPDEREVERVQTTVYQKYGIALAGNRIGNMGFVARRDCILRTIEALGKTLAEMGYLPDVDAALEAARRVFDEAELGGTRESRSA